MLEVTEYLNGGSLTNITIASVLNEYQLTAICKEVLKGVQYLHEKNIVHRDIKSDIIIFGLNGKIKIIDFGFCARLGDAPLKDCIGTSCWMAPEVTRETEYGKKIDVWSFGITLVEMIDGVPPFNDIKETAHNHIAKQKCRPPIVRWSRLSPSLQDFIRQC